MADMVWKGAYPNIFGTPIFWIDFDHQLFDLSERSMRKGSDVTENRREWKKGEKLGKYQSSNVVASRLPERTPTRTQTTGAKKIEIEAEFSSEVPSFCGND